MGTTMIIIHDIDIAHLLLEKKSGKTSARPVMEFAQDLCGFDQILVMRQYDDSYQSRRKLLHKGIGTKTDSEQYGGIMEAEAKQFIWRLMNSPEQLNQHLNTTFGAIILKATYGYNIDRSKVDVLVTLIDQMLSNFSAATVPLGWMVDAVTTLKKLPDWLPGMGFKKTAREWKKLNHTAADVPYEFVKGQMSQGIHQSSYTSEMIQAIDEAPGDVLTSEQEEDIKWSAASMYSGGVDTTVATLSNFFLAMIQYPEVQRKAQEEIDRVIGGDRLPRLADRESMPYLAAVAMEAHRWGVVGPMGLPHVAQEDIIVDNYTIPQGAYLLPAVWWFCHDPARYSEPEKFDPSRYLEPRNEPDPKAVTFGFGRRICPGRFFADTSIFLTIAHTLAVFDIGRAVEESGKSIDVQLEPQPGAICHPKAFKYSISPRSEKHAELIKNLAAGSAEEAQSDAHLLKMGHY